MKSLLRALPLASLALFALMAVSCAKNESGAAKTADGVPAPEATATTEQPAPADAAGSALAPEGQPAPSGQAAPPAKRPASGSSTASTRPAGAAPSGGTSAASGWGDSPATRPAVSTAPAQPVLKTYTLPSGSTIRVQTTSTLSTKTAEQGAPFSGSLAEPIEVDGKVIAARGANVTGRVVTTDPGGRVKGKAYMEIAVNSIELVNGVSDLV